MSSDFQTAVRSNVSRETRVTALDRLAEAGDTTNLRLFVELDGMPGGLRRYALNRLADRNAGHELEQLAERRTLPPELQDEARRAL